MFSLCVLSLVTDRLERQKMKPGHGLRTRGQSKLETDTRHTVRSDLFGTDISLIIFSYTLASFGLHQFLKDLRDLEDFKPFGHNGQGQAFWRGQAFFFLSAKIPLFLEYQRHAKYFPSLDPTIVIMKEIQSGMRDILTIEEKELWQKFLSKLQNWSIFRFPHDF